MATRQSGWRWPGDLWKSCRHKVTILAEAAEKAEEIDTARAEAAKKKAEAELQKSGLEINEEAQEALQRAQARLDVAGKGKSKS